MPFKPGQSGNPGGRKKENNELRELCGKYTIEAVERLIFWMQSDNPKASVAATNSLLDRAHGKPIQQVDADIAGGLTITINDPWKK